MKWKTKKSQYLVNDRWLKLRADTCETPSGAEISPYYVFEYPDWVNVVVLDDTGKVWMLNQYRQGAGEVVREIVAGAIEQGETPEQAARREALEELGYEGGECVKLGVAYANPANHTNKVNFMLIHGGSVTQEQNLEVGETMTIESQDFEELLKDIESKQIVYQSLHLSTILLAEKYLNTKTS